MEKYLKIDNVFYQILSEFKVMHSGWESDDKGYTVITGNGEEKVVFTNHGKAYFAHKEEILEKVEQYQSAKSLLLLAAIKSKMISEEEFDKFF